MAGCQPPSNRAHRPASNQAELDSPRAVFSLQEIVDRAGGPRLSHTAARSSPRDVARAAPGPPGPQSQGRQPPASGANWGASAPRPRGHRIVRIGYDGEMIATWIAAAAAVVVAVLGIVAWLSKPFAKMRAEFREDLTAMRAENREDLKAFREDLKTMGAENREDMKAMRAENREAHAAIGANIERLSAKIDKLSDKLSENASSVQRDLGRLEGKPATRPAAMTRPG